MPTIESKIYKNEVEENESFRLERNERDRHAAAPHIDGSGEIASDEARALARAGVAIAEVEADSIAEELGLAPGDRLLEIDGVPARDVLQLKKADLSERLELTVLNDQGVTRFDIEKEVAENIGIGVDAELFDGVRRCTNKCPFCFVDQLPPRQKNAPNLRRTLYVRDDDYRLSFLHGHYITLTNLKDEDYARIIGEKLSPLCVSVHATDPATRIKMVGNARGGEIMERLRFLIDNGISINAQIVLCPGWNDGELLDRSITELMGLYPGVASMAVVPAGLTRFLPPSRGLRTVAPEEAERALDQLAPFQRLARGRWGVRFVYASDEMYLLAGRALPSAAFYDGFPQYANGVGTIRAFLDEVSRVKRRKARSASAKIPRVTLVTGELAAPALSELAAVLEAKSLAKARVLAIKNTFWGGNVACAGLIMGQEILAQLPPQEAGDLVFLPPDAVDRQGRLLDDVTLDALSERLGVPVRGDATGPLDLARQLAAWKPGATC